MRYELSLPARMLGSWDRIQLVEWISECTFCVGTGLAPGLSPAQGVILIVYRIRKLKMRTRPNKRAVQPQIIIIIIMRNTIKITVVNC
jgi:hypothetical protein